LNPTPVSLTSSGVSLPPLGAASIDALSFGRRTELFFYRLLLYFCCFILNYAELGEFAFVLDYPSNVFADD